MSARIIETTNLGRRYGARVALHGLDLTVRAGQIVGIAGPNGAGKSTLLQVLAGLIRPSAGGARVFGLDPWRDRAAVMQRARFAFAPPGLWGTLTAREHVVALAAIGRSPVAAAEVDTTLALVGLLARADDRVVTFSFGMRQRLALAIALLPRPELLVLDEPAEGLDPLAVLELRAILRRLRDEHGVTLLLSSHLLLELDALVDHLVVLDQGAVLCAGAPSKLRGLRRVWLRVDDAVRAREVLATASVTCTADGDDALWLDAGADVSLITAQALLSPAGVTVHEYANRQPSLEQALLARLRAKGAQPA